MREIKFRAWDKKESKMGFDDKTHSHDVDYWDGVSGSTIGMLNSLIGYHDHFVIMQYTGLKDKNGKEIYEGDITKAGDLICEIKWGKSEWVAKWKHKRINMYSEPNINFRHHEVIGNIYENPELLK